ncbi:MAG TPA: UDP-3-O-(3-hydroxymyristoyl)glucosamine N-acyltransferase [Pyrinomonadaceae bacterium]|nr:UDP-3-O-(3-hydroxymyristoyl)glucosamine N-acyltransferase [Pyrinomonadaceae bacterium]
MTNDSGTLTAKQLADHVGGQCIGDGDMVVESIADLRGAPLGTLAFVENQKSLESPVECNASCLIVSDVSAAKTAFPHVPAFIQVTEPKLAFAQIAPLLHPPKRREPLVHPTAVVAPTANLDLTVYLGPLVAIGEQTCVGAGTMIESGVTVGDNVTIGTDCVLHPGVVLYDNVSIGDRVILHAGVCIGADGFGYVRSDMGYHKFPQQGTVVIEDEVELGAYTCVDRAALGVTRIGKGTKLDNLVHVGHNCDIGERVVIAAQTGISGSVIIEDDVVIGGQVGFGDHIRVRSGAVIGSKAGVLPGKIVRPGVWWGIPIQPLEDYKRLNAHLQQLPNMRAEIKELKRRLEQLEKDSE